MPDNGAVISVSGQVACILILQLLSITYTFPVHKERGSRLDSMAEKHVTEDRAAAHAETVDKDSLFTNYAPITSRAFATSLILELLGECICCSIDYCRHGIEYQLAYSWRQALTALNSSTKGTVQRGRRDRSLPAAVQQIRQLLVHLIPRNEPIIKQRSAVQQSKSHRDLECGADCATVCCCYRPASVGTLIFTFLGTTVDDKVLG